MKKSRKLFIKISQDRDFIIVVILIVISLFFIEEDSRAQEVAKVSLKRYMSGIYSDCPIIEEGIGSPEFEKSVKDLKKDIFLSGLLIGGRWNEMEPREGKYDFSQLDAEITMARKSGKFYKLKISPGIYTPEWVYEAGAVRFETFVHNPNRFNYGNPVSIPLPWDPIYQDHFSRLISKLGERYSKDSLCIAVVLSCANYLSAEMHLPRQSEDMKKWESYGNYMEKLLNIYQKFMDEWAQSFPNQQVCLHESKPFNEKADDFIERIFIYGLNKYPHQFTFQSNGLNGRMEKTPEVVYMKYKDKLHNGFQNFASFDNEVRQGSIEMAVLNFIRGDAEYWEGGSDPAQRKKMVTELEEARKLGYVEYKKLLLEVGLYRKAEDDIWSIVAEQMRKDKAGRNLLESKRRTTK